MTESADGTIRLPIAGDKLIKEFWIVYGLITASEALKAIGSKLPGFVVAQLAIDKELAEERNRLSINLYSTVAKAGVNLDEVSSIETAWDGIKPTIIVHMADLVDQMAQPI